VGTAETLENELLLVGGNTDACIALTEKPQPYRRLSLGPGSPAARSASELAMLCKFKGVGADSEHLL